MKLLLISPYHGGSHQAWADGYGRFSTHQVDFLTMPARFWKWRMHGAAVTLARRFNQGNFKPHLLVVTDMLDLTTFLALTRETTWQIPVVLYMHENQLTYPLPADGSSGAMRRQLGERDHHYAFINFASMLSANQIWFNSRYHLDAFYNALPNFLKHFPEYTELGSVSKLRKKSEVVHVGIDFGRIDDNNHHDNQEPTVLAEEPLILWNQRWEYDKDPETFFRALCILAGEDVPFRAAICGQQFGKQPPEFARATELLGNRIYHVGYADEAKYLQLLREAAVTISTAQHEFFGISILEAIYAAAFPILPARLSYPELLPSQFHELCLYKDFQDLLVKLRLVLTNPQESQRVATALSDKITAYDWRRLAPEYDARFAGLAV